MKICLIDPPLTRSEHAGKLKRIANILPSLGLGYLATVLKKDGFDVSIIDCRLLQISADKLIRKLKTEQPRLIGITATTLSFSSAATLAKALKAVLPGTYVVLGGAHVTAIPAEALCSSEFEIGVIGEGEYTFLELAQQIRDDLFMPESIKGLVFKQDKEVKINPARGYINDLDSIGFPARELYPSLEYYKPVVASYRRLPFAHILTSRGCPFQCTFCDRKVFGNKFRARSVAGVMEEIEELVHKYKVREIKFFDDTFTMNRERVDLICEEIIKRKLDLIWSCLSHVRCVDQQLLIKMKQAGCWQIGFGLESGDEQVLASMKKGMTLAQSRAAVLWAKKAGLNVRAFFVIGMPGDTLGSIQRSLEFAQSLPIDVANFYNVTLYPGNELFELVRQEGTLLHKNWHDFCQLSIADAANPAYIPKGMNQKQLRQVSETIHKRFYLRPKYILSQLKQIRSFSDIKRYFNAFLAIIFGV